MCGFHTHCGVAIAWTADDSNLSSRFVRAIFISVAEIDGRPRQPYSFHQVMRSMFVPLRLATDARGLEFVVDLDRNIDEVCRVLDPMLYADGVSNRST